MLELMRLPYVGCGVAASAVCMDKVLQKNIIQSYGLPVVPFYWFTKGEWERDKKELLERIKHKFESKYPLFVKPANQGSSIGITKAHTSKELELGIELALSRDTKVIVEAAVSNVREIECSVIGRNDDPKSSVLGEIIPGHEFYDYEDKYLDGGSQAIIPAQLSKDLEKDMKSAAEMAFQVLDCWGLARVDFLVNKDTNEYFINELNTMPGFTPISMYPKLWEASGLKYEDLLTQLINLALERHTERAALNLSR
jgi:D-alanine-D-alanine ligase